MHPFCDVSLTLSRSDLSDLSFKVARKIFHDFASEPVAETFLEVFQSLTIFPMTLVRGTTQLNTRRFLFIQFIPQKCRQTSPTSFDLSLSGFESTFKLRSKWTVCDNEDNITQW